MINTNNLYERIGSKVKQVRTEMGMSQKDLAEKVDFSSSTAISLIESGERNISIDVLQKIASLSRKNIEYFLNDEEKRTIQKEESRIAMRGKGLTPEQENDVLAYIDFIKKKK